MTATLSYALRFVLFGLLVSSSLAWAEESKPKLAIHVGKILTCVGEPIVGGTILVSEGKIEAVGKTKEIAVPVCNAGFG